jgi:FkbM family methyltransferase
MSTRVIKPSPFVFFGAGPLGVLALERMRHAGIEPLVFCDNNAARWHLQVEDVEVLPPEEAIARYQSQAEFVVTIYNGNALREDLKARGCRVLHYAELFFRFPDVMLPHCCLDVPDAIATHATRVNEAQSIWADDASRAEYSAQLQWRRGLAQGIFATLPPTHPADETYFPLDVLQPKDDEVFVDCGAFDGDVIPPFLERWPRFHKYIAIEADPHNFQKLKVRMQSLPENIRAKFELHPVAIGEHEEPIRFAATGTVASSRQNIGEYSVPCMRLDDLLKNQSVSFIKMDIEGAEPQALQGARELIQTQQPAIAICLYHAMEHLWEIPLLIRDINSRYKLFLRRHAEDCWESVCYAIPPERCLT